MNLNMVLPGFWIVLNLGNIALSDTASQEISLYLIGANLPEC